MAKLVDDNGEEIKILQRRSAFSRGKTFSFIDLLTKNKGVNNARILLPGCTECSLGPKRRKNTRVALPHGKTTCDTCVMGYMPTAAESRLGDSWPYASEDTRAVVANLASVGRTYFDTYFTHMYFCPNTSGHAPMDARDTCRDWKNLEFRRNRNLKYFFIVGIQTVKDFMGLSLIRGTDTMGSTVYLTSILGRTAYVFPLYSDSECDRLSLARNANARTMKAAQKIMKTGGVTS